MRNFLGCAAFTALAGWSGIASAQISEADGESAPAPATAEPTSGAPAPTPAASAAAAPAPAPVAAGEEEVEVGAQGGPRFRWGVSGMVGPSFGVSRIAVFGFDARFGAQVNDVFGFYAQPMFQLGVGFNTDLPEDTRTYGQATFGMAAMFDVTIAHFIYLAAGPEYVNGVVGLRDRYAGDEGSDYGPFFSVASRIGVVLGKMKAHRRRGLAVGIDTRVVLVDSGVLVTPLLSAGYEYF